ncbi:hypothetical protein HK096_006811 [Nowakowskiella sp. JEL0078]|nr:hypothetical protein HK096_006811 [Nowakowskiella sp. JEL0078]
MLEVSRNIDNDIIISAKAKRLAGAVIVSKTSVKLDSAKFTPSLDNFKAYALIGILDLAFGRYVIFAKSAALVATVQTNKIFRLTSAEAFLVGFSISDSNSLDELTLAKHKLDRELLDSIIHTINSGHTYFCETYDITHSLQHNFLQKSDVTNTHIDNRYFFNFHLLHPHLSQPEFQPFLTKIICGFVGQTVLKLSPSYTLTLISRLSTFRLGTRYNRRGLDLHGNASNSVESEQIVFSNNLSSLEICSFVQVRGSVPLVWKQPVDLSYRPKIEASDSNQADVWKSIQKHMFDLKEMYTDDKSDRGSVLCINLLNTDGFEGVLTKKYEKMVEKLRDEKIHYVEFPVNKYCKNHNYANLELLFSRIQEACLDNGFFIADGHVPSNISSLNNLKISRLQAGLARISCLDSLDRTNMTSAMIAKNMLNYQVYSIIPIEQNSSLQTVRKQLLIFQKDVTNLWADSGDAISILYAGTRALRSDVVRTGKRQWLKGSFDDGVNSLTRYYLNNFFDGKKQDGYDFWGGKVHLPKLEKIAKTEGVMKIRQDLRPIVPDIVPEFISSILEPFLQALQSFVKDTLKDHVKHQNNRKMGHIDEKGVPHSYVGFVVTVMRLYLPRYISSWWELTFGLVTFTYMLIFVRIFGMNGAGLVDKPRLSGNGETDETE